MHGHRVLTSRPSTLAGVALAVVIHGLSGPEAGVAQSPALLRGIDLKQVGLEIVAPSDLRGRLQEQILTRFAQAGYSLSNSSGAHQPKTTTLALTVLHEPLHDGCPDKTLQSLSLSIIDSVVIVRNGVAMRDRTWSLEIEPRVRSPLSSSEWEQAVSRLLDRFLDDYEHANPPAAESADQQSRHPKTPRRPDLPDAGSEAGLIDLSPDHIRLSVLANRSARTLTRRAYDRLAQADIALSRDGHEQAVVTLGVELVEHPLGGDCPGHVLYETGLFLVEEVRSERAPDLRRWTDTWTRQSIRVVPPVSEIQRESDQDALLDEFIRSIRTWSHSSPDAR